MHALTLFSGVAGCSAACAMLWLSCGWLLLPLPAHPPCSRTPAPACCRCCLRHPFVAAAASGSISPAGVSAAMARRSARWGLARQEDAHEFLTALLDGVQSEVLAAHVSLQAPSGASQGWCSTLHGLLLDLSDLGTLACLVVHRAVRWRGGLGWLLFVVAPCTRCLWAAKRRGGAALFPIWQPVSSESPCAWWMVSGQTGYWLG